MRAGGLRPTHFEWLISSLSEREPTLGMKLTTAVENQYQQCRRGQC